MYRSIVATVAVCCLAFTMVAAQEENKETKKEPTLEAAKTVAEIEFYLAHFDQKVRAELEKLSRQEDADFAGLGKYLRSAADEMVVAGEKMLTIAEDDDQRETAYNRIVQGHKTADHAERTSAIGKMMEEKGLTKEDERNPEKVMPLVQEARKMETESKKKLDALIEKLEKEGKFLSIVYLERFQEFTQRMIEIYSKFDLEKFEQLKAEAKQWTNRRLEDVEPIHPLMLAVELAETEEATKIDPLIVDKTVKEMIAFVKSADCTLSDEVKKDIVEQLEGYCRRCVGATLDLYGKTLDDKDFDWQAFRDKYVLVKFTSSWCVPCKQELPGMREAYAKYKDKGFDIVSVYVMDQLKSVRNAVKEEKLPWTILSEELTEKAGQTPQGKAYNIQGVPTMLLIDKEGKVILTEASGEALQETLKKLLGTE